MLMKSCLLRLLLVILVAFAVSCQQRDRYVVFSGYAQGGVWTVTANMRGVKVRDAKVKEQIDLILTQIDRSLSGYNKNSILSAFNAGEPIIPDTLFLDMYERAVTVYDATGGCVDVAAAPLYDIWGFGFKSGEMPSDELVAETLASCGMRRLRRNMAEAAASDGKQQIRRPFYGMESTDADTLLLPGISGRTDHHRPAEGRSAGRLRRAGSTGPV